MEDYRRSFWKRIAVLCRYGRATLHEAMAMPVSDSHEFIEAISDLVENENRLPGQEL